MENLRKTLSALAVGLVFAGQAPAAPDNDYPTLDRVEYILSCARDANGPAQENIYKCVCVIDAIAKRLPYQQYIEYSTAAHAFSIGGERGEVMRGYRHGKEMAAKFRKIQAEARQGCFMAS